MIDKKNKDTSKIVITIISLFLIVLYGCKTDTIISLRDSFIHSGTYNGVYWPTGEWRSCSPDQVGFDPDKLKMVYDYIENPNINTEGIIIIKDGYIVAEAYFRDFNSSKRHASYSIAKSFISALVGIAINKGFISGVDKKVFEYFNSWTTATTDQRKKSITLKHLLTMSSGLKWNESDYYNDTSRNDVFKMAVTDDFIQYVLDKESEFDPGTVWRYSSGDSMLLSGIIQRATGQTAYDFAYTNLLSQIGLSDIIWESDPAGHTIGGWGINATVREYAKFGYLYLNRGKWDGNQIIPEGWIDESFTNVSNRINYYGYQWWFGPALNGYEGSGLPDPIYIAWGIYTQQIFIIPSYNLLIVRVADDPGSDEWSEVLFLQKIINAIN